MKRKELLKSKEYWLTKIQIDLFNKVEKYIKENNMSRTQLAQKLGVSKGYVSQILNGDADHRLSKLVELSLAVGVVPYLSFESLDSIIEKDSMDATIKDYNEIEKSRKLLTENGYLVRSEMGNYHKIEKESLVEIYPENFFSGANNDECA